MENRRIDIWAGRGIGYSEDGSDETDLPPEYCQYTDDGCEFAGSCLGCSLPKCIYDLPGGKQRWLKELRDKEVVRQFSDEGKEAKELAVTFDISQRTVQRILKRA